VSSSQCFDRSISVLNLRFILVRRGQALRLRNCYRNLNASFISAVISEACSVNFIRGV
jgi:hypothetical protein